jgi:hypothetical protein
VKSSRQINVLIVSEKTAVIVLEKINYADYEGSNLPALVKSIMQDRGNVPEGILDRLEACAFSECEVLKVFTMKPPDRYV